MTIGKKREQINIKLGSQKLEQVTKFVYLGGTVTEDDTCMEDIKKTISTYISSIWKTAEIMEECIYHKGNKNLTL